MVLTKLTTKKIISLPGLQKKAQVRFNHFIVLRDKNLGCISCGREVTEAGHYYSQGHYSALRYSEINTNGQCTRCNCFLHGNLIHYRSGLIKRYGQQRVDLLDSSATRNGIKKWSRGELEIIIMTYKQAA